MKKIVILFVIAGLSVLVGCSSSLKVTSDYNKGTDFSQYKTFSIATFLLTQRISTLNVGRIIDTLECELVKKALTKDTSAPDIKVGIAAILKDAQS